MVARDTHVSVSQIMIYVIVVTWARGHTFRQAQVPMLQLICNTY